MTQPLVTRDRLVAAAGAGIVSGLTLAAFAAFAELQEGRPVSATYAFLAAAVGGNGLAEGPAAVPVGLLVLFLGTILWAYGYVTAARSRPQLLTLPVVSGAVFGPIVWLVMQLELVAVGRFSPPSVYTFYRDMFAFVLFFGIPLAWTAARLLRAR